MTDGVVVVIKNGDNHLTVAPHGEFSTRGQKFYEGFFLGKAPPQEFS
jgi:hypothetical protein